MSATQIPPRDPMAPPQPLEQLDLSEAQHWETAYRDFNPAAVPHLLLQLFFPGFARIRGRILGAAFAGKGSAAVGAVALHAGGGEILAVLGIGSRAHLGGAIAAGRGARQRFLSPCDFCQVRLISSNAGKAS